MKRTYTGLTMVELITVVSIIALIMALLIPSVAAVRRLAKETQQRAQITTLDTSVVNFQIDNGYYPPSNVNFTATNFYGGAQMLADALFGRDLLGFFPDTAFNTGDPDSIVADYVTMDGDPNHYQRKDVYVHKGTASVFSCAQLNLTGRTLSIAQQTNVICDVFGRWPVQRLDGKVVMAGVPILYYRANATNDIETQYRISDNDVLAIDVLSRRLNNPAYNFNDNPLTTQTSRELFYGVPNPTGPDDYGYIQDPTVTSKRAPYNPDSFLLISAGPDGIYGNADDITNFR